MSDQWTHFLTSLGPPGQKRSTICDYCHREFSEHGKNNRCPIPNCTLEGQERLATMVKLWRDRGSISYREADEAMPLLATPTDQEGKPLARPHPTDHAFVPDADCASDCGVCGWEPNAEG